MFHPPSPPVPQAAFFYLSSSYGFINLPIMTGRLKVRNGLALKFQNIISIYVHKPKRPTRLGWPKEPIVTRQPRGLILVQPDPAYCSSPGQNSDSRRRHGACEETEITVARLCENASQNIFNLWHKCRYPPTHPPPIAASRLRVTLANGKRHPLDRHPVNVEAAASRSTP